MTIFTKKAVDIYAPQDAGDNPRAPVLGEAQVWGTEVETELGSGLTLAALKAKSASAGQMVYLRAEGREGHFIFDDSDLSTEVSTDTKEGVYVAPDSDATGASGAWVRVHHGVFRPEWFGLGETSDDGPVYTALLTVAALVERSPIIDLEGTSGVLGSDVDFSWSAAGDDQRLVIRGGGSGAAQILVPESNTTGMFKITLTNHRQQIKGEGFSVLSQATADGALFHTGLWITSTVQPGEAGWGSKYFNQCILRDVNVGSHQNGTDGQWYRPIRVEYMWQPIVANCWAYSESAFDHTTDDFIDDGTGETCGVELFQCYNAIVEENQVGGKWRYGIRVHGAEAPDFEDGRILNNTVFGRPREAIVFEHTDASWTGTALVEVGGYIHGNHTNPLENSIRVKNARQLRITDNFPYALISDSSGAFQYATAAGIRLDNCSDIWIGGNQFCEEGFFHNVNEANRNILIEPDCRHIHFASNMQGTEGVGIWVGSGATDITIDEQHWGMQASGSVGDTWTPNIRISGSAGDYDFHGQSSASLTPEVRFGGGSTGITYTTQTGGYYRTGNRIDWWISIVLSSKGTDTGNADIALGSPHPATGSQFAADIAYTNAFGSSGAPDGGLLTGSAQVQLFRRATNNNQNAQLTEADFNNTSQIRMSGSYFTD